MKTKVKRIGNNKGITLIVLVITIIILLILAGASIEFVFNQNKFIGQSKQASEQYEIENIREQLYIIKSHYETEKIIDNNVNRERFWEKLVQEEMISNKENVGTPEKEGTDDIYTIVTNKGYQITIIVDTNENITIGSINKIGGVQQLAEKLTFKEENILIEPNQTQRLEIEITPHNTTNTRLKWASSDEEVATVKDGVVTAIKEGTTTITAETTDGSNITTSCTINVKSLLVSEKLGYASDGLILHYDGIQNTREGQNLQTTIWEDLSGNKRDATLNGGVWNNYCLALDGSDDGVYIGNQVSDLFKTDNTIEITVLFNESDRDIIIGNYSAPNNINYEKYSSNNFRVYFNDGDPDKSSNSNTLKIGSFQTLTYVMNKVEGKIETYDDANKIDSATTISTNITNYNANWNSVWVGRDSRKGSTCLSGNIASVRVYNRRLSNEEIIKHNQIDKARFVDKKFTIKEVKEQINENNISNYIGKEVEYQPEKGGTWRVFYFDTEGKFSPQNSIILKRDDAGDANFKPEDHYDYEPNADIIEKMKKADPAWAKSSYSNSVNSNAEKFLAWSCDPSNWTGFYDSNNSEFISCTPSLDLYITSLSKIKSGLSTVSWTSDTVCRYGSSGYNVLLGTIPTSNNGVYTAKSTYYLFSSPSSYRTNYFWACDFAATQRGLYAATGNGFYNASPIVYLK